jgi:hypothetical protein
MLTPFQQRLVKIFLSLEETNNFALAGGAALVWLGIVDRTTHDLDLFAPFTPEIRPGVESFKDAITREGLGFEVVSSSPSFVRLVVTSEEGEKVLVDSGQDSRLHEPQHTALGRMLSLPDLAADKLLALFGRAEARDYLDLFFLAKHFPIDTIMAWAKEKDPGLDFYVLAVMIGKLERHARREFETDDATLAAVITFFQEFRAHLIWHATQTNQTSE